MAESKTIQAHPDDGKEVIGLMRIFQWRLHESAKVKTKSSHVEMEGDNLVAIEEVGYIKLVFARDLSTTLIGDEEKNYSFVKLVFSRDSDIPGLEELKKLEEGYFSIQFPTKQNNPEKIAEILDECRMLYPDYDDVPQHVISPDTAIQSEKSSSAEGQLGEAMVADADVVLAGGISHTPLNSNSPDTTNQPKEVIDFQSSVQSQPKEAVVTEADAALTERASNALLQSPSLVSTSDHESPLPDGQCKIEKHTPSDKSSAAVQADPHSSLAAKGVTVSKPMLGVVGGIFLLIVGGGYYFLHHKDDARLEELAKREAEIKDQQEKLAKDRQSLEQAARNQPTEETKADVQEPVTVTATADALTEPPAPVAAPAPVVVPAPVKTRALVKAPVVVVSPPTVVASPNITSDTEVPKANSNTSADATTSPPKTAEKTIDEQYNERAAKECKTGFFGLFCRETMKLKLCDGKWTENPPQGQSLCKQIKSVQNN